MPSPEQPGGDPYPFWKGHGTENDFVLLPDADGTVHGGLTEEAWAARVRALCHRHAGLGADGVLRVVRAEHVPDAATHDPAGEAEWFMDYRNADGSLSEMCGNGVRVFALHLLREGLADPAAPVPVGTRDGVKTVTAEPDGRLSVEMGVPRLLGPTEVSVDGRAWPATHVDMGNPHAVVLLDGDDAAEAAGARLAELDLLTAPGHDTVVYPDGVNVELVVRRAAGHLAMRVHERGSGETRSCGTGASAAQAAAAAAAGAGPGSAHDLDVPGGRLRVTWRDDGQSVLTGPAVLHTRGTTTL